jgi:hypothetical protein
MRTRVHRLACAQAGYPGLLLPSQACGRCPHAGHPGEASPDRAAVVRPSLPGVPPGPGCGRRGHLQPERRAPLRGHLARGRSSRGSGSGGGYRRGGGQPAPRLVTEVRRGRRAAGPDCWMREALRMTVRPAGRRGDVAASFVVRAAVAAPSVHNSQPWYFSSRENVIRLHADPRHQLQQADPAGREMVISCGAALWLRPGFRRRCRRLWVWSGGPPRRRRRQRRRHWRRDRWRFHWFGPRRFRLRGFAGHWGFMGRICGHPEMIPSQALAYRGGRSAPPDQHGASGGNPTWLSRRIGEGRAQLSPGSSWRGGRGWSWAHFS